MDKAVRNIDGEVWRKFAGYCKFKKVILGEELSRVMDEFLKKNVTMK